MMRVHVVHKPMNPLVSVAPLTAVVVRDIAAILHWRAQPLGNYLGLSARLSLSALATVAPLEVTLS